jgi:hypothetical protein
MGPQKPLSGSTALASTPRRPLTTRTSEPVVLTYLRRVERPSALALRLALPRRQRGAAKPQR